MTDSIFLTSASGTVLVLIFAIWMINGEYFSRSTTWFYAGVASIAEAVFIASTYGIGANIAAVVCGLAILIMILVGWSAGKKT